MPTDKISTTKAHGISTISSTQNPADKAHKYSPSDLKLLPKHSANKTTCTTANDNHQNTKHDLGVLLLKEASNTIAAPKKASEKASATTSIKKPTPAVKSSTKPEGDKHQKPNKVITLIEKFPSCEARQFSVDDIKFIKKLGSGAFSQVFLIQSITSKAQFALKVLQKDKLNDSAGGVRALHEKDLLVKLHHPGLVHFYGSLSDPLYEYLVLEYINGRDLFRYLRKLGRFNEEISRFFSVEVIVALDYLHSLGIIYRDLKPENIIVEPSGHLRLIDFGLAIAVDGKRTSTFCGTAEYIAPEMLRNEEYGLEIDYYGLGIFIFELLVGRTPFYDNNRNVLYDKILSGLICWDDLSSKVSPSAKDCIQQLIDLNPKNRLGYSGGLAAIKDHPWFDTIKDHWDEVSKRSIPSPFNPSSIIPVDSAGNTVSQISVVTDKINQLNLCDEDKGPHPGTTPSFKKPIEDLPSTTNVSKTTCI